ncbi:PIN domain-containing protein [Nocardia stercoris]|uniref:Ribonuclease VapC n=1 Tax=Nocardia stercoris TaxID=2483361 RepID=A0A3M2L6E7_9NOCA|nr:PIN domain nuclease [Nocardia stercoris]RMI32576.1 PIN domain nuclease [Nocardia stercoris]
MVNGYLVDRSALARLHLAPVRDVLVPMMDRALVSMCGVTELELLSSARTTADRVRVKTMLNEALEWVDTPEDLWDRASELQAVLTSRARDHATSIASLVVAVTAQDLGLTVLHYNADFDAIAEHTGQATHWVVPAGVV